MTNALLNEDAASGRTTRSGARSKLEGETPCARLVRRAHGRNLRPESLVVAPTRSSRRGSRSHVAESSTKGDDVSILLIILIIVLVLALLGFFGRGYM